MPEPRPGSEEIIENVVFLVNKKPDFNRGISSQTSIEDIIKSLIEKFKLDGTVADYALVVQKSNAVKEYKIVTEQDKASMQAQIIELTDSPAKNTQRILQKIGDVTTDAKELDAALEDLKDMSVDATFAAEFIAADGLSILMRGVSTKFRLNELGVVLHAINSLVEHQHHPGSGLEPSHSPPEAEFIKQLAELTRKEQSGSLAIRCALSILALFVDERLASDTIDQEVAFPDLIALLSHNDVSIQLASLGLINSLLAAVPEDRKREMAACLGEQNNRLIILDKLLGGGREKEQMMGRQLYLLQHHMFSLLQARLHTQIQPQDNNSLQKIKDLRATAFDTGSPGVKNNAKYAQDYTKLGFKNTKDPSEDFHDTPPGILALDCMDHFAKQHQEKYMKVVLENSCRQDNHECPFAESSCELVTLLADILGVGKPDIPNHTRFHEMFFKVEFPFEEFYSHCIVILNKTWRDMRATRLDFPKVLDVVREQIETSLMPDNRQERPKTFESFRCNVKSYSEISKKWQMDAKSREAFDRSKPVAELREHLKTEIEELIRQQRANFMVEGTRFPHIKEKSKVKDQYKYVKLHTNHKTIYVGDWSSDKSVPTIEDLEPRLHVSDIKDIRTGEQCEFLNRGLERGLTEKGLQKGWALALIGENEKSLLELVAPDQVTHNYWVDGINTLLRRKMDSADYQKENSILTNMEIKLRLLDLEGVDLPEEAPPIPPLPSDFNFASC